MKCRNGQVYYLGVMISADEGTEEEIAYRLLEERKVRGTMANLWKENMIPKKGVV